MPLATSEAELHTGVESVDQEHQRLLALLNELQNTLKAGGTHEAIGKILDEAILYLYYHFTNEEELFLRTNYPDCVAHCQEHQAMKAMAEEICEDFQLRASDAFPQQVLEFFKYKFNEHTLIWDSAFTAYLKKTVAIPGRTCPADAAAAE